MPFLYKVRRTPSVATIAHENGLPNRKCLTFPSGRAISIPTDDRNRTSEQASRRWAKLSGSFCFHKPRVGVSTAGQESGNVGQAIVFWKSDPSLETPDVQIFQGLHSEVAKLQTSADSMMMAPSIVRPKSRGHLRLTGPNPLDPIEIHANILGDPGDLKAMTTAIELCRDIADFSSFLKREITPGSLKGSALEQIVRNSVSTIGTRAVRPRWDAIPCRSSMAILRFYGIENLRIADGVLCRAYQPATQWRLASSSANAAQRY